jgi:anthranilate synthase component 2
MIMKILIIDNYDSFTYNIVHAVKQLGHDVDVRRNDKISLDEIAAYNKIIISPGPGIPSEAGIVPEMLRTFAPTKSILGICLGHQAIGECFGATLLNLPKVYHGIQTPVRVVADDYLFDGLSDTFNVGRYHSWVVDNVNFPDVLEITAVDSEQSIMALRHKTYDVRGVQFHPESILTPDGTTIINNWLKH